MAIAAQRWRLAGLIILAAVVATGCNLPSLLYFLAPGPDPRSAPELMKLEPPEKDKEVKVVIWTYSGVETRPEFITADRDLTALLARELQQFYKENKEKIAIVPTGKVQEYKNNHPELLQSVDLKEVGKHFEADYVIYLEIDSLSLYETGSRNTLYRGRAGITVSVVDMHNLDDEPVPKSLDNCVYPTNSKGPLAVDESTPPRAFYLAFMNHIAKRLSWFFVQHEVSDEITCD